MPSKRPVGKRWSGTTNIAGCEMAEERTYPFRIHYRRKNGTNGIYYIKEANASFAITAFLLRTGNERESVISVEMASGHDWKRAL